MDIVLGVDRMTSLALRALLISRQLHARTILLCAATGVFAQSLACERLLGIEPGLLESDAGPTDAATANTVHPDASPVMPSASNDASDRTGIDAPADQDGDFAITLGAQSRATVVRGSSAALTVTVVPGGQSVGAVTVTASDLPDGVSVDPLTIPATATSGTLVLRASISASLTVAATLNISGETPGFTSAASIPLFVQDPRGTLDVTFGDDGVSIVPLEGENTAVGPSGMLIGSQGLAVQPDGKIVFCGDATAGSILAEIILGRFTADGILDRDFAGGGLVTMNAPGHDEDVCRAVRVLRSGGLAIGGFTLLPNNPHGAHAFLAAQFASDGGLDPTFGNGGFVFDGVGNTDGGGVDSKANYLAVQPDGKLILGGFSGASPSILRLLTDGGPDSTFGTDGVFSDPLQAEIMSVAVLPNSELLAPLSSTGFLAVQVEPDGSIDRLYGSQGYAMEQLDEALVANNVAEGAQGIAVQPDGKAVLVGATTTGAITLVRFDTEGQLDPTFGDGGVVSTSFPAGTASAGGVAVTQDNGFAVCANLPTSTPIGVVRYAADGSLDAAFAGVGYAGIPGIPGMAGGEALAIDAAGRIIVGAFVVDGANDTASIVIARFWP